MRIHALHYTVHGVTEPPLLLVVLERNPKKKVNKKARNTQTVGRRHTALQLLSEEADLVRTDDLRAFGGVQKPLT